MSSQMALLMNIKQVLIDLKSDRAAVRAHALENVHNVFDNRSTELTSILRSNNSAARSNGNDDDDDDDGLTWSNLFNGLHDAIKDQCIRVNVCKSSQSQKTLITKNDQYKEALRKCINVANAQVPNVSYKKIYQASYECFSSQSISTYFDALYLQIVYKHILNAKHNIGELGVTEWNDLLSIIFNLLDDKNTQIPKLDLLQCIPLILRHGSKYTYLMTELHQYLPNVIRIANEGHLQNQLNAQKQILLIVYEFIRNLAIDRRSSVVSFTEQVLDKLLKLYEFTMDGDSKRNLIKIMHISIIIHSPEPIGQNGRLLMNINNDLFQKNLADDADLWNKHLRNMLKNVVEREIIESRKRINRLNATPSICPIFVRMAAKLSSMVFWNNEIWNNASRCDEPQQQKKRRQTMALERIMEHIEYEPKKFCWRWFAVMSQLMVDFPHLLQTEDYQPLLQLLIDIKPTIQHSLVMKCFTRIAKVMLSKEPEPKRNDTLITDTLSADKWHEILELSFKQAETDNTQLENVDFMRVLVENKVIVSHEFVKNLITAVAKTQTIKKSNNSIRLLISVLENVNTDMIDGIKDLKVAIIQWLSTKIKLSDLKKVIENNNTTDKQLVSILCVLCTLSRHSATYNKESHADIDNGDQNYLDSDSDAHEHEMFVAQLMQSLQYRMMSKLIVSDAVQVRVLSITNAIEELPDRHNVKASMDERIYSELEMSVQDSNNSDNSIESFNNICASLVTNVNILNSLVGYEAIDHEKFSKLITQGIFIKIEQLNTIVATFGNTFRIDRNAMDVNEIVDNLISIWHENYHPIILENLFIVKSNLWIIKWLEMQLKPIKHPKSIVLQPLKKASQLSFEEGIQLKCLTLLVRFSAFQNDDDGENVFELIENYTFNYRRNEDLFIVFQLIKIILNVQRCPSKIQTNWALGKIEQICNVKQLSTHHDYMELIVDQIPAMVNCIKPHADNDSLVTLISIVLKQCKKQKFGPSICIKIIKSVQYFAQEYYADDEECLKIIGFLKHFLLSEYYTIQLGAVSCLTNIFNKHWLSYNENDRSCLVVQNFHMDLAERLNIDKLSIDDAVDIDRKACIASVRLQLYCSIIGMCYALRKEMWFNLIELCGQQLELNEAKTHEIVEKLCVEVFNSNTSQMLGDLIPHFIALWIDRDHHLSKFPAKLSNCQSQNEFMIEYMDTITLRIIQNKPEYIPHLLQMFQKESLSDILSTPILIKCLAKVTATQVCLTSNTDRKSKAVNTLKILRKEKPSIENYFESHSMDIIEELFANLWDAQKFTELFENDVEFVSDENTIDYKTFMSSLDYVTKKSDKASNVIHYFCEMSPRKVIKTIYTMRLHFQTSICEELKLTQLLRLCVLIEIIVKFVIDNAKNENHFSAIGFFIREFIYFLGNMISSNYTDKLKLATCKFCGKLLKNILPDCAKHVQLHLNYIVSVLLPIIKTTPRSKLANVGMQLLHFLIVEQTTVLKTAIGKLDSFPMNSEFEQLRTIQNEVKYNGISFSLLKEIEYFLLVDKRKIEGLLSLKEHLVRKKNELHEIYRTIYDTRGFSEDCERSPIHRLISALLSQIVQNVDSEKSLIAAKCLGELGPNDLGSIALKFDVNTQTYKVCKSFDHAACNLCEHAMEKLNGIFIHSDANVLQAAAKATEDLLRSHAAIAFLENYPLLRVFETGVINQHPLMQRADQLDLTKIFNDVAFSKSHSYWAKSLAIELFTLFRAESLAQVAATQTPFAVAMIPLIVKVLLMTKSQTYHDALNTAVNRFFSENFKSFSSHSLEVRNVEKATYVYLDKVTIKLMLNVAECIRVHNQNSNPQQRIELNNLHIAKAALYCEVYFTAILYVELAVCEGTDDIDQEEIRMIMKHGYQSIGEFDAVSACLDPIKQRTEYLEFNRSWDQILIGIDTQLNAFDQYANYLAQAGLYNLANKLTQGNNSTNFECAWRLADWSIVEDDTVQCVNHSTNDMSFEFNKYHYFALKSLRQKEPIGVKVNVERAFNAVIKMFKQSSYECTKNIYKNMMMLHLLQQIEEFSHVQFPNAEDDCCSPEFLFNKWKYQDRIPSCGFNYREPILAQRSIIFQSAGVRARRKIENACNFTNVIQQMILNLVSECRAEGFFNLGERYSVMLHKMELLHEMKTKALIEDAQLNWQRGESEMTQHMISTVIKEKQPTFTHARALGMMGEYMADGRLEDTKTIIDTYFLKSIRFSSNLKNKNHVKSESSYYYYAPDEKERLELENRKRNYQAIAKYADREYQQIAAYRKSTDFEKKFANIQRNKSQLADMEKRGKILTSDERKTLHFMSKSIAIDESDVKSTTMEYEQYLQLAIEHYIQSLIVETENELSSSAMFRLFGLWFSNIGNEEILKEMTENFAKIGTHKFIALMPQITTHISSEGIKDLIQNIVYKCAVHHPYHVLPKVLALFNAFKDEEYVVDPKQKSKTITNPPRTDAACNLLHRLKHDTKLRDIIVQMEKMCEVLIRLANTTLPNSKEFSSKEPIRHLRDLNLVHCPTVALPLNLSGDYDQSIVSIHKWKSTFSIANGVNKPKIIECIGANGQNYKQLLKGTDDLRQDAVMQQVFNIMNDMLNKSKVTKKDRLHIRTYNIMPLSQRSGILEWCDKTMPLTDYLIGNEKQKGAHQRFRPQDWPPSECRKKLSQVSIRATTFDNTYKTFKTICQNIQPVFHQFFLEHFYNPGQWFERRMSYAHSLATTSMIGYILGIGDRHVSNILIDKITAELIHIDFGIAFEQGKCLPTPEMIPFRLTRDLVKALGPTGVEGVFRKSCEKTMEVLRQNKSTILTIVEVLLHDPLYAWTLTSNQAAKRQETNVHIDIEDQDINTMAERAMIRLEEKLDGKHVSCSESISVKRHVEILIKEAMNEKLLCKLFVGWQPYL